MPVTIANIEIENFKRIRVFRLEPNQIGLTTIGGNNQQGKTSVLDAICYALGGERMRPSEINNDKSVTPAVVKITLSNGLVAERSGKNAALKVTDPLGVRSGQKILDDLLEELALQLPKFMNANPKDKAKTLLRTLGIEDELDALETAEKKEYDERTVIGREYERKQKFAEGLMEFPDAPPEKISVTELAAEMRAIHERNAQRRTKRMELQSAKNNVATSEASVADTERRIAELQKVLEEQKLAAQESASKYEQLAANEIGDDESTESVEAQIKNAEDINVKVELNQKKLAALEEAKQYKAEYEAKTAEIEKIRSRRDTLLKSVKMPLDGLSVVDGLLVYNGKHWDCMSSMEQMKVSTAICHAVKPSCGFVLLDRLECFDNVQLGVFSEWLEQNGIQGIATRVSTGSECAVILEDGMVAEKTEDK